MLSILSNGAKKITMDTSPSLKTIKTFFSRFYRSIVTHVILVLLESPVCNSKTYRLLWILLEERYEIYTIQHTVLTDAYIEVVEPS
jgi:hypothetical protein